MIKSVKICKKSAKLSVNKVDANKHKYVDKKPKHHQFECFGQNG